MASSGVDSNTEYPGAGKGNISYSTSNIGQHLPALSAPKPRGHSQEHSSEYEFVSDSDRLEEVDVYVVPTDDPSDFADTSSIGSFVIEDHLTPWGREGNNIREAVGRTADDREKKFAGELERFEERDDGGEQEGSQDLSQHNCTHDHTFEHQPPQPQHYLQKMEQENVSSSDLLIRENYTHISTTTPAFISAMTTLSNDTSISTASPSLVQSLPTSSVQKLLHACIHGHILDVESTWRKLGDEAVVACRSEDGWPPVYIAAFHGHLHLVEFLVRYNLFDKEDRLYIPLHGACLAGNVPLVAFLLDNHVYEMHVQNTIGWTPLHAACSAGQLHVVKYLVLERSANTELTDDAGKELVEA